MSQEVEAPRASKKFKKRYVAIVALSALALTGGVVGAEVLPQSTIAGNKVNVAAPTASKVSVVGSPKVTLKFEEGVSPKLETISTSTGQVSTNAAGAVKITLKNDGEMDAVVKAVKIPGLENLPMTGASSGEYVGIYIENDKNRLLRQVIAKGTNPPVSDDIGKTLTIPGKSSVDVWAYVWGSDAAKTFEKMGVVSKTFPINFEFGNASE